MPDTADGDPAAALTRHEALIAGLQRSSAYPHAVDRVQRIDTHISTVLLAGQYAYKLKKPVALGFLDFSTLEQRRRFCEDEVRLNQRTAPQVYLDAVPIVATPAGPAIALDTAARMALDYAVRMRRFDNDLTLDRIAARRQLTADHIDRLASAVARLHAAAQPAPPGYGAPDGIARWNEENFVSLRDRVLSAVDRQRIDALDAWAKVELQGLAAQMAERAAAGFVRECHGDLHLGNIVLLDDQPVPFDAVEFNPELRFIDVFSDIAFTLMDLNDHGVPELAWRLISAYLEHTGDYGGLVLLRFYAVYRALVRAKVALIHLQQPQLPRVMRLREHTSFEQYLALAERLHQRGVSVVIVMSGLSGSGKSTVAQMLVEQLGAVRIRSDVERKRLHGLAPDAQSGGTIYSAADTKRTYAHLAEAARAVISAGIPAIVDAAFLRREERDQFRELARQLGVRHALVYCEAPVDVLSARVAARGAAGRDASEAGVAVLQGQLQSTEPPAGDELTGIISLNTATDQVTLAGRVAALAASIQSGQAHPWK